MRKLTFVVLFSLFTNFAQAEMLGTFGKYIGDEIYDGYQVGIVQPLTEFDASAGITSIDDGFFVTIGAQKGMELFTSTVGYVFFDINRFFWDSDVSGRIKTQLAWGAGVSIAAFEPIMIDLKIKKFESYSDSYIYLGIAYMF